MATPTMITVVGELQTPPGVPDATATVVVEQQVFLTHSDGTMIEPTKYVGITDASGQLKAKDGISPFQVPATTDPAWIPLGFTMRVTVDGIEDPRWAKPFRVGIPHDALGGVVTLGQLLPQPASGGSLYAPLNHSHLAGNRITSLGECAVDRLRPTGQVALTDRQMVLTLFTAAVTETIMSFGTTMPNAGLATGSTHSWVGVYKLVGSNLVPDAVSVDDPSKWTAQGSYDTPIFDPAHPGEGGFQGWDKVAGQTYAGAFLWRGGGNPPQLPGALVWSAEPGVDPRLNGYVPNQDFPPTAPFPVSSILADFRLLQVHFKR